MYRCNASVQWSQVGTGLTIKQHAGRVVRGPSATHRWQGSGSSCAAAMQHAVVARVCLECQPPRRCWARRAAGIGAACCGTVERLRKASDCWRTEDFHWLFSYPATLMPPKLGHLRPAARVPRCRTRRLSPTPASPAWRSPLPPRWWASRGSKSWSGPSCMQRVRRPAPALAGPPSGRPARALERPCRAPSMCCAAAGGAARSSRSGTTLISHPVTRTGPGPHPLWFLPCRLCLHG